MQKETTNKEQTKIQNQSQYSESRGPKKELICEVQSLKTLSYPFMGYEIEVEKFAFKDRNSYLLALSERLLKLRDQNQWIYEDHIDKFNGQDISRIIYIKAMRLYLIVYENFLALKLIDGKPPRFFLGLKLSQAENAVRTFEGHSQYLLLLREDGRVLLANIKTSKIECCYSFGSLPPPEIGGFGYLKPRGIWVQRSKPKRFLEPNFQIERKKGSFDCGNPNTAACLSQRACLETAGTDLVTFLVTSEKLKIFSLVGRQILNQTDLKPLFGETRQNQFKTVHADLSSDFSHFCFRAEKDNMQYFLVLQIEADYSLKTVGLFQSMNVRGTHHGSSHRSFIIGEDDPNQRMMWSTKFRFLKNFSDDKKLIFLKVSTSLRYDKGDLNNESLMFYELDLDAKLLKVTRDIKVRNLCEDGFSVDHNSEWIYVQSKRIGNFRVRLVRVTNELN